ncbi:hypothetical protein DFS34DRAFT_594900 [Phlyctochytrium arcticum]|nr:hypothetical protein DFS34DRAFT_594900 [Phlyctochytrium arcticum]
MKTYLCDVDECVWATYIKWYEEYQGVLEDPDRWPWNKLKDARDKYIDLFRFVKWYPKKLWSESFEWLNHDIKAHFFDSKWYPKRSKKFCTFYQESKAHVSEHHHTKQTILPVAITSDGDSSFEVVEPSTPASDQDTVSISDEISDPGDAPESCATLGIPQDASKAGKEVVAQSEMEIRLTKLENALLECKNQMEVMRNDADEVIQKAVLECKNEMEAVQKNAAADHEQAFREYKKQMEALRKTVEDSNKGMASDNGLGLGMPLKVSEAGEKCANPAHSALVTRNTYLEKTLMGCNKRIASLEQSLQKNRIDRPECQTQQSDQHDERGNADDIQPPVTGDRLSLSLFEKEHLDILVAALQRLGPIERLFFGFLQWYEYHEAHLTFQNLRPQHLLELQTILANFPEKYESADVCFWGMQSVLDLAEGCMSEDQSFHTRWMYLQRLYYALRQCFREWWDLNGNEIADSIDIDTNTSLDDRGNPPQTLPEGQKMSTETLTRDNVITDAGSTDHDLKKKVALLQAVIESTREENRAERALAQSRHEQILRLL